MKLNVRYEYKSLKQINSKTGPRVYDVGEDRKLPSVTTILSATKPKEDLQALKDWRKRVGDEEANRVTKQSTSMGSDMHDNLEKYILTEGKADLKGVMLAKMMTKLVIKNGLSKVDEVWGTEAQLYYPELYAGTTDLVGIWNGKPAIMDFKNSRKTKKEEWIEDYKYQLVAYAMAHNELFGTDIKTGVIMMATHGLEYQEFVLEGKEFDKYKQLWLNRVYQYYENA
jgi:genome maintenance exonuclease 1